MYLWTKYVEIVTLGCWCKGVSRNLLNIYGGIFSENKHHLRCLTGFWMHLLLSWTYWMSLWGPDRNLSKGRSLFLSLKSIRIENMKMIHLLLLEIFSIKHSSNLISWKYVTRREVFKSRLFDFRYYYKSFTTLFNPFHSLWLL